MFYLFFFNDGRSSQHPASRQFFCVQKFTVFVDYYFCKFCMFANMEQETTQHPTTTVTVELQRWVVAILKTGAVRFSKTEEEVMQEAATAYARGVYSLLSTEEKQQNRWGSDTV